MIRKETYMVKVGLCDDEEIILNSLKRIVSYCADKNHWEIELFCYVSGEMLMKDVSFLEVIFLDIDMPNMDGIEIGKKVLENNPDCCIIIETGKTERFKEAFYVHAHRFVTKPFDEEEIDEALRSFMLSRIGYQTIELYKDRIAYIIMFKDILYFEAYNGYSEIIVQYRGKICNFRSEHTLTVLETMLPNGYFFRIDRKNIVNLTKVSCYEKGKIKICDRIISVSRRRKKEFEWAYVQIDLEHVK